MCFHHICEVFGEKSEKIKGVKNRKYDEKRAFRKKRFLLKSHLYQLYQNGKAQNMQVVVGRLV